MVAKLNILKLSSIRICRFKEEAYSTITFFVGQDFLADILVRIFFTLVTLDEFHSIIRDVNLGHICLVALLIVSLILILGHLTSQFSLVVKDLVKSPILKKRIDRLPVTSIITQGTVLNIGILKVAIMDCFSFLCFFWFNLCSCLISCLLESLEVFLHDRDIVFSSLHVLFGQAFKRIQNI